ncbi:MAG: hypothetical protein Ct9H300mP4_00020 [Gammaproteobacteria bacterium]|nr:MAG: hypothetical protein Ct9H300mP4_00020 [Gammaproteobacteria bacterium]
MLQHKKISALICVLLSTPVLGVDISQEIKAAKENTAKIKNTDAFLMPLFPLPTTHILKIGLATYLIKIWIPYL